LNRLDGRNLYGHPGVLRFDDLQACFDVLRPKLGGKEARELAREHERTAL
jgi:hypothetical protein